MSNMQSLYSRETGTKAAQIGGGFNANSLSPAPFGVCSGTGGSQPRFNLLNQSRSVTPNQVHQPASSSNFFNFYQSSSAHSPPVNVPRSVLQGNTLNGIGSSAVAAAFQGVMNRSNSAANYFNQSSSPGVGMVGSPNRGANVPMPAVGCYMPPNKDLSGMQYCKFMENSGGCGGAPMYGPNSMGRFGGGMQNSNMMYKRFYGSAPNSAPFGLSENEFPCLPVGNQQQQQQNLCRAIGNVGRSSAGGSYGSHVSAKPTVTSSQPEFQIENEDFPALPGSEEPKPLPTTASKSSTTTTVTTETSGTAPANRAGPNSNAPPPIATGGQQSASSGDKGTMEKEKTGIQMLPDGTLVGLAPSMLRDHFGMAGMIAFLKSADKDPAMISLLLGHDLTQLGVNLNSAERDLYPSFGGPWFETTVPPNEVMWDVPQEYRVSEHLVGRLPPVKLNRYIDDLLFYFFYHFCGETYQMVAAAELYQRDWRYHMEDRVWLTRAAGMVPTEKTATYERGTYYVFDPISWRKIAKEMLLEYSKLEDRPSNPFPPGLNPLGEPQLDLT
ncbi:hypothetical protein M514_00883 [Trichuris suis]|uniref:NOT2/NOT3/NOT5 C-terminal domain-containing protein n=1 Tax=Trichuris suis TaxID=68888 RepID=A0A085MYW8_9BILA|nr:hypothetical protein M513_00883 [Trichuris suis]KFD62414.1 hypothetical protein M514_00883 [Trichuris suis]KHJ47543.1 NOT2 / NOT3 / NOT5 family protein [Trichuris suis]